MTASQMDLGTEPPRGKPGVLLIDLSAIFWSAWHASGDESVSTARARTIEGVNKCITTVGGLAVICCDSGRSFRKDIDPKYKAQRPEKDHASINELERVKQRLRDDGRLLWEVPGFEADDVIATACGMALEHGHHVTIASGDKDLFQLAGPSVQYFKTNTWSLMTSSEAADKFGVMPSQIGDWIALVGDAADNIQGCPGIGPKNAATLLQKWGSIGGIFAALEKQSAEVSTPAIVRALQQNVDVVKKARELVALRADVPIEFAQVYEVRKPKAAENDPDMQGIEAEDEAPEPPKSNGNGSNGNGHAAAAAPPEPIKAMVVQPPSGIDSFNEDMLPTDMKGMWWLATRLQASRLYDRFPSKEAILVTMLRGRELGLSLLASLDCFHIIDNKPCPYAYLIIDLATRDPKCEYIRCVETDAAHAIWETKHRDHADPMRLEFTYEEAKAAGLPKTGARGPNAWLKTPADMCRKACGSKLARFVYPGSGLGLISVEEMGGDGA